MKILHTSDWHLGKRLEQCERTDEHQHFLDWLLTFIRDQQIEVLLIAGDVFDTGSPSNAALKQYYDFLWALRATHCREVVIIGGNHDSVATLNAPQSLLKYFSVHVVGGVPAEFTEQIISIKNDAGSTELVICAVPFLRDKDVRLSVPGETHEERETRLKQGICAHYQQLVNHIAPYKQQQIPVIAMGHLFAAGGSTSESEKEIHVGNLGQICGDQFPEEFDYIALGHLHRPQIVNKMAHIRYSGSPIPLSFSEVEDSKLVLVLDFVAGKLTNLTEVEVPCCRKLIRLKGDLDEVKRRIISLNDTNSLYPAWVEVQVETENFIPDLDYQLTQITEDLPHVERVFTRQIRLKSPIALHEDSFDELVNLQELDPKEVFQKKCTSIYPEADFSDLLATFDELLEKMGQAD
ncbi:exonuclease SbcCD subunit D C-terminal domain-containing protein [Adhaeribacter radiodurans]|uniref:Nuclease SbcCD subunit D n=1 Tax=Adhaeribacter radiodurans TaxID=2745197 RepID=A0A7L7L478_9BACT|nr:exonuclease SbcCD subunit D C-terminal domain-containing protein [Adhaeribacter radiodurans]QMU27395.1 exonuclease SbcCD subunit D C-terminal domain-containing protein [Adhaeribacter radiodurans]